MAGTIPSLSLAQFNDINGKPLAGARLYLYQAATVTPVTAFKDYGLTAGLEHPFPIVANAIGVIPSFWLADGYYRARLTDKDATVIFDELSFPSVGISSGGGGGGTTVISAFETGDVIWQPISGAKSGWVRHNGRTVGSATSGATERANDDCEPLFAFLWNNYANTICPVLGGRGASAASDWAAAKQISTIDMRGYAPFGLDDMGNTAAGRFTGVPFSSGSEIVAASKAGAALHSLTANENGQHDHIVNNAGNHTHPYGDTYGLGNGLNGVGTGAMLTLTTENKNTSAAGEHTHTIANSGLGQAHNNTPLAILGTYYVRL